MNIRANYPIEFNPKLHIVTEFKMNNYNGSFLLCDDLLYRYTEETAFNLYTEGALLALSNVTVVKFKKK